MRRRYATVAMLVALTLVLAACGGGKKSQGTTGKPTVRLGTANFTEQYILGRIYKNVLEKNGYKVDYKENLGGREVVDPALQSSRLDMLIEYAGSDLVYLKGQPSGDADKVLASLKEKLQPMGISVLDQAPMSDQEGIAVTQSTATKYNLKTLSDLAKASNQLLLGGPPECATRETCLLGLEHTYGMKFKSGKSNCPGGFCKFSEGALRYKALLSGDIQVSVVFTTDGIIAKQHLVVLEDDKKLFPPDHAVPIVRTAFLNSAGGDFQTLVNRISSMITTEEITALNGKVDLDKADPQEVAKDWLTSKGLL